MAGAFAVRPTTTAASNTGTTRKAGGLDGSPKRGPTSTKEVGPLFLLNLVAARQRPKARPTRQSPIVPLLSTILQISMVSLC
jgi:hypothetical protein